MSNETQAPPAPAGHDEVGRLTRHTDDEQYQAEPTDPTIFSGHADTRRSVNIWQLIVILIIATPITIIAAPISLFDSVGDNFLANLLLGLVVGVLVSGAILAWRYRRGKE